MKQLSHHEIVNSQRKYPITLVCDPLRTPQNIGMCFRVAESFGVQKLYLHEFSPNTENRIIKRTARNTIQRIPHEIYADSSTLIKRLKQEGNTIIGLEVTDSSIPIQSFDFANLKKITLLLGSERYGIENTDELDHSISIPMFGLNSSMNVIHSLAITLYEVTNQFNKARNAQS